MISDKKKFLIGLAMMITFIIVLVLMFSPIFGGKNALEYSDELYNSISKGSAYYVPVVKEKITEFNGKSFDVTLSLKSEKQAKQTAALFKTGEATVKVTGKEVNVSGDVGKILDNCLSDSDAMYHNNSEELKRKHDYEARQITYNWWCALKDMDKKLSKQKKFKEAKIVALVSKKVVETSYNYYEIEPQKIMDKLGIVIFSLIFYVLYTIWYGFAILFLFEGWGMKLGH